jgi:uncharacterized protein
MLIYIHGFNSSPQSNKAILLKNFAESIDLGDHIIIPQLHHEPAKALSQLERLVKQQINSPAYRPGCGPCLIGSSLGGYYATSLAEKYDCRAVLINPAVKPYELFNDYLGPNKNEYTDEEYELTMPHLEELRKMEVEQITNPDRYLLMLQTGDEVLDYKLAIEKYAAVPSIVEEGGGHEFMGFQRHLETVLAFCGINCLKTYS